MELQENDIIELEPSVGNNIIASSSILGFTHPEWDSDSGLYYAILNVFPIGCSKAKAIQGFPNGMAENLTTKELLNNIDFGLFKNREEMNYPPLYGDGIELPIGVRAFGSRDMKRFAEPTKKARAENF
ncbi:hypothetical protein SUGI_0650310 [Cryptomeria japonica]|nr:hypothetical protein SUGI_0650310 [Cryptomeria japonica]